MKIVVALANHHGSGYHRALVPLRALAARGGYDVTLSVGLSDPAQLDGADVFYLPIAQNETMYEIAARHQAAGGRVVYEVDDDYRATPLSNPGARFPGFAERVAWMNRFIALADGVIVATPTLAAAYADLNDRIFVCRNTIDPADTACFFGLGEPPDDGEIRIGWAGSESHGLDVAEIVGPLTRIFDAYANVRLLILGADFRRLFPQRYRDRIAFVGHTFYVGENGMVREFCYPGEVWPVIRYYQALASLRLHIGLAPLTEHPFNDAKSYLKVLEYGALGIPAIASDTGPYREYAERAGGAGSLLLARDRDDWERMLTELIESAATRERLRRANRSNVLHNHLVYHQTDAWAEALQAVVAVRAAR
jgi:glycosyltransferase involved in cell wall biosynthesis